MVGRHTQRARWRRRSCRRRCLSRRGGRGKPNPSPSPNPIPSRNPNPNPGHPNQAGEAGEAMLEYEESHGFAQETRRYDILT